jgi:hypothetical protein
MIQYIYFVKCPNCEDEYFDFFDEAKAFALGCLSQKPVITQVEVDRNDFGECTDSIDHGVQWSWEDECRDIEGGYSEAEPAESTFTKDDLKLLADGPDPEFDALDNSVDFEVEEPVTSEVSPVAKIPDNFRKPIPDGMTVEELVEEMEENEDTVECTWCNDLFDKSECRKEVDLGWLCGRCEAAIKSRGETLTFRENNYWDFLDESTGSGQRIRLVHKDSKYHSDGTPYQLTDLKNLLKSSDICELDITSINLIAKFDNNCKIIQETDKAYLVTVPCYYRNQQDHSKFEERPKYIKCWVPKAQTEFINESVGEDSADAEVLHDLGNTYDGGYPSEGSRLAELEDADEYSKRLTMCPECGEKSYDAETSLCISCGFN